MKRIKNEIRLSLLILALFAAVPGAEASGQSRTEKIVEGNTEFALSLYGSLRKAEGNLFFSPYSLSTALAMTYGGARERTAKEMAEVLRFPLSGRFHKYGDV